MDALTLLKSVYSAGVVIYMIRIPMLFRNLAQTYPEWNVDRWIYARWVGMTVAVIIDAVIWPVSHVLLLEKKV